MADEVFKKDSLEIQRFFKLLAATRVYLAARGRHCLTSNQPVRVGGAPVKHRSKKIRLRWEFWVAFVALRTRRTKPLAALHVRRERKPKTSGGQLCKRYATNPVGSHSSCFV